MARPPKDEPEKTANQRLEKRHVDMVNEKIKQEWLMAGGDPDEYPTPMMMAIERRNVIGKLIEKHLSFEALHPVSINIIAPMLIRLGPLSSPEDAKPKVQAALEWMERENKRLTKEAPELIQETFAYNALRRNPDKRRALVEQILSEGNADEIA